MKTAALEILLDGGHLDRDAAHELISQMVAGEIPPAQQAAILAIYRLRKITLQELIGFREGLFSLAKKVDLDASVIDVCGTGGDGKSSYNVSTAVAFVLAGAGIKVAKHGNHGVSSSCGSSTVLEHIGVTFTADPVILNRQLDSANLCFLHAPLFHPVLKNVAMLRKELGVKTFFNILGPLLNPAAVKTQLVGVYNLELARLLKYYFQTQKTNIAIVHSFDGFDEISLAAPSHVLRLTSDTIVSPATFGLTERPSAKREMSHGVQENAAALVALLENRGDQDYRDMVLANSAIALQLVYPKIELTELAAKADESLRSGRAHAALKALLSF